MPGNNFFSFFFTFNLESPLLLLCNKNANYLRAGNDYNVRSRRGLYGPYAYPPSGLQVVSASGECTDCWTQNCKSCNLCALRLRTANCECNQQKLFDLWSVEYRELGLVIYIGGMLLPYAVCTNFSNYTKAWLGTKINHSLPERRRRRPLTINNSNQVEPEGCGAAWPGHLQRSLKTATVLKSSNYTYEYARVLPCFLVTL